MAKFNIEDSEFEAGSFEVGRFEFSDGSSKDPLETTAMPSDRRAYVRHAKQRVINALKKSEVNEILPEVEEGNSYHVISRGNFDSFNFLPVLQERYGVVREYYFTTWALNRENVVQMMSMFDTGKVLRIRAFVGTYLKRRETAVWGMLFEGLRDRGQSLKAFRNHTKIQMLDVGGMKVVIEGSANLTANGNCENFVITVDEGLYEFHKGWLEEIMSK